LNHVLYHHASTQTARKKKKIEVTKFCRETQTINTICRSQQTARESGTQMSRNDLLIDTSKDVVIVSKPYFSAEELEILRDNKSREIQCFLRQCFSWRKVRRLREAKQEKVDVEIKESERKSKIAEEEHTKQIVSWIHLWIHCNYFIMF
jgi:hypothetical protein